MRRAVRLLASYFKRYYLERIGGLSFLITLIADQAVMPLIGLAVWSTALGGERAVTSYFVALLMVRLLTASYENHTFSGRIYDGDLAEDLLRPHPVVLAPLAFNLAMRVWQALLGLPLLVGAALLFGADYDPIEIATALPALLLAGSLRFLFTLTLAMSAFWTERAHGAVAFGEVLIFLLGGEAAPVAFMPEGLRLWAEALPFRAMLGFPAEVASGTLDARGILFGYGLQLGWGAVLALLALSVWIRGLRRYTAVGG